jgi:hypothetical protein
MQFSQFLLKNEGPSHQLEQERVDGLLFLVNAQSHVTCYSNPRCSINAMRIGSTLELDIYNFAWPRAMDHLEIVVFKLK